MCFKHDEQAPTKDITFFSCHYQEALGQIDPNSICDFDLNSGKYAWVDELNQHLTSEKEYGTAEQSQLFKKKTKVMCNSFNSFKKRLNNGRTCQQHSQCVSYNCVRGNDPNEPKKCRGRTDGEYCNNHADCDAEYFCDLSNEFPFLSTCKRQRSSYEPCIETYQC